MNWLARLKKIETPPDTNLQNLQKPPFVGFVGTYSGAFENSEGTGAASTGTEAEPASDGIADIVAARLALFTDRGLNLEDAQAMADRLAGRDQCRDERRLCMECSHLSGGMGSWRCSQWRKRQHYSADIPGDLVTEILHRCAGFNDRLEAIA